MTLENFGLMKTFLLSKLKSYPLRAKGVKNLGGLELLVVLKSFSYASGL